MRFDIFSSKTNAFNSYYNKYIKHKLARKIANRADTWYIDLLYRDPFIKAHKHQFESNQITNAITSLYITLQQGTQNNNIQMVTFTS